MFLDGCGMWMRRIKCKGVRWGSPIKWRVFPFFGVPRHTSASALPEWKTPHSFFTSWPGIWLWYGLVHKTKRMWKRYLTSFDQIFWKVKGGKWRDLLDVTRALSEPFFNKNAYLFRIYRNVTQLQRPTQLEGRESQIETWRVGHLSKYTTSCIDRIH